MMQNDQNSTLPRDANQRHYDAVIIGGGCAGLSLARQAQHLPYNAIAVIEAKQKKQEHAWGIFLSAATQDAALIARKTWHRWQIITPDGHAIQSSQTRPYAALESKAWLGHCRLEALDQGVDFINDHVHSVQAHSGDHQDVITTSARFSTNQVFDSRPNAIPEGMMIQHFIGHEVQVASPVFDPETAILMDFRCDQSRGIHFIYVLPFSPTQALVESTIFSPKIEEQGFYENAISRYLNDHYGISEKIILRREQGAIPMGIMPEDHRTGLPIGGRGGAIRPSSGYAFTFIQKQIATIVQTLTNGQMAEKMTPHLAIDLLMDKLFLRVLHRQPKIAPRLFLAMAKALSGDDMARFMAGEADFALRLKVIMAMPKWAFIKALIRGGA